ncbi:MAG: HAD-IA family hydrolase [Pseudomonadota bacterium]
MQRLAAIIFDVDGTLAETEEVHRLAFNYTFSEFGLDWEWTPALYEDLLAISGGRRRIAQFGHALRTRFKNDVEFEEFVTTVHKAKTRKYAAMIQEGEVPLRPGVRRLIDEARAQNLTLAMATSSAQSNLEALLDMNLPAGWRDWFAAIETCENVGEQKPASAVYKAVLQTLGIECSSAVAIEDTVNGLLAATGAGLATVIHRSALRGQS